LFSYNSSSFSFFLFFFFFSSRRRHTRWPRDWSSDVCSSDLAERLAKGHVDAARDRDRVPQQALGRPRVVVEDVDDHPDLATRVADRLAYVAGLELGELAGVVGDGVGEAAQQLGAVARADGAPRGIGSFSAGDGEVGVFDYC